MDIFLGNLPRKTSVLELRKLIGDVGQARFRIVSHRNKGKPRCYGMAVVDDRDTGRELITRLDGAEFNGSELLVRHFLHRSDHNERRSRKIYPVGWNGINRRRGDRRLP